MPAVTKGELQVVKSPERRCAVAGELRRVELSPFLWGEVLNVAQLVVLDLPTSNMCIRTHGMSSPGTMEQCNTIIID
eukprot:COSAG02_NODE_43112_length_378_cov_0.559140_1_plen_77_part_10